MLPDGTYSVQAVSFGTNGATGLLNLTVKGAAVQEPTMTLLPNGSISVNVKEQFTSDNNPETNGLGGGDGIRQNRGRGEECAAWLGQAVAPQATRSRSCSSLAKSTVTSIVSVGCSIACAYELAQLRGSISSQSTEPKNQKSAFSLRSCSQYAAA